MPRTKSPLVSVHQLFLTMDLAVAEEALALARSVVSSRKHARPPTTTASQPRRSSKPAPPTPAAPDLALPGLQRQVGD